MAGYPPPYTSPGQPGGPPSGQDWRYQRRILRDQARAQRAMIRAQRDAYRDHIRGLRRGSIVGPLLVVAIGVLFLLIQTGRLHAQDVILSYAHWWPLLLVGVGVILLIEWVFDRNAARNSGNMPTGEVPYVRHTIGGGVITLLILLAIAGIGFSGYDDFGHGFFSHGFSLNPDNIDEFLGDKHESDQNVDQLFPAESSLTVTNPRGDVTVSGSSDDNQIHIALHKQVFTRSDSEADSRAQQLSPHISTSGNTFNVTMPTLEGAHADLTITVPRVAPVTVTANHGDVHVNSVNAPVAVTANHGDIEVNAVTGPVISRINNGGSSFSAHNIIGPLTLEGHGRDLTLSDISGPVIMSGEFFGTTHLEHIRSAVKFHTSRTDFQLARLDGEMEISPRADLSASEALGPVTLITRNRNVSLERIAGDLSVTNSNGSIDLSTAPPLGNVTVENRNGSVSMSVPEQASFTVQARTNNGDVENDFSLPSQESDSQKNFSGTIGKGGALIRINTTEGDIALRKASLQPLPTLPPMPPMPPMPSTPSVSIHGPEGGSVIVTKNGTRITSTPDGTSVYHSADGTQLTRTPDGTIVYIGKDGTRYNATPDGTKVYAGSNGVRITSTAGGNVVAIGPGGRSLSDAEVRDEFRHAEDLVRKAEDAQRREREKETGKNQ
jgi:DUF4097 and DUF4098 domain-containing protein YvlB